MRKESRYLTYISLIFLGVIFGMVLTTQLNFHQSTQAGSSFLMRDENFSFPPYPDSSSDIVSDDFSRTFIEINKLVTPSVVSITAVREYTLNDLRRLHGNENQDFWERLNPFRSPRQFRGGSSGSGIIVHHDGYILTNTHVVKNASRLEVTLYDNRTFHGEIVGVDSLTEVAVIKIKADDLPVARLGDSDNLAVGQWVLAIGNPLELRFTITAGIISAIGRQMDIIGDRFGIENFIQTDAVINPGNSGGALVDLHGRVIGVNTAIATRSGYYEGYGFAIPINLAKKVMEDLITKGRVIRAFMGIAMLPMNSRIARAYGLEKPQGVFIDNILEDSPAEKAGILPEDIILAIDSTRVNQSNQIQTYIAQKQPGDQIQVTVFRKGTKLTIPVILAERQTSQSQVQRPVNVEAEPAGLGLEVKELTRRDARELHLSISRGVLVTKVKPFSKAAEAGLFESAVILEVNDKEVNDVDEFWNEINKLNRGEVAKLLVQARSSQPTHLFIEIP